MSEGHKLQGTLLAEAESGEEFDPSWFAGTWDVFVGNSGPIGDRAVIQRRPDDEFGLYAEGQTEPLQILIYHPGTRTLDSRSGDRPERSISFWDTRPHGREKSSIFAVRRSLDEVTEEAKARLLPWERDQLGDSTQDHGGAWGADAG